MSKFTFYATSLVMIFIGIMGFVSFGYNWALGETCEPGGCIIGLILQSVGTLNLFEGPPDNAT